MVHNSQYATEWSLVTSGDQAGCNGVARVAFNHCWK